MLLGYVLHWLPGFLMRCLPECAAAAAQHPDWAGFPGILGTGKGALLRSPWKHGTLALAHQGVRDEKVAKGACGDSGMLDALGCGSRG